LVSGAQSTSPPRPFFPPSMLRVPQFKCSFHHGRLKTRTLLSSRHSRTGQREGGLLRRWDLTVSCRGSGTMACAQPKPIVCFSELTRSIAHVSSLPSHPVLAPGSAHCHLQTSVFAWATRSCGLLSACASEHPSCDLTAASAGQRSRRTVTTVSLAVAVLADISAMLWPMTSSSEPSDQWTCMLSWSRHAFCAAMESAPMEPPSIRGSTVNILFGTLRVRIRSPRRTSTSPLWRQGQQHLRPSPASGPSTPSCRPRGTTDSRQSRLRHSVRGVLARSKPVRTWGVGLRDIPAMRERPLS